MKGLLLLRGNWWSSSWTASGTTFPPSAAGADAVLDRIYHEHTVAKAYLGEILALREWTSADENFYCSLTTGVKGSLTAAGLAFN